jgi:hypothetical protein
MAWLAALAFVPATAGLASCGISRLDYCMPESGVPPPNLCDNMDGGGGGGTHITCGPGTVLHGSECVPGGGDASDDAADGDADGPPAPACTGQCAPYAPVGWLGPDLLWIGSPQQMPTCPVAMSAAGDFAYADLDASASCAPCQCDPPTGSCGLPSMIAVSPESCEAADAGAGETPFNPPAEWDGGCTGGGAIDAGALCDGGPCAQSATIAPLTVNETVCAPLAPTVSPPPISQSSVLLCEGSANGACAITGESCLPSAPGFATCVFDPGDQECVALLAPYTQKILAYTNISDTRTCSACTCDAPTGSVCSAEISIYSDGTCASSSPNANPVDSTKPVCVDLITGAALGSKSASAPTYTPGACQAGGGVPSGSAVPVAPTTFCCIPTPLPPPLPGGTARP